jgi:hypothetical protein
MSSLLERMVKRTRAPLPGIEPLLKPRFARRGASAARSQTDTIMQAGEFSPGRLEPADRFPNQAPTIQPEAWGDRDEIEGSGATRSEERVAQPDAQQITERHSPEFRRRQSEGFASFAQAHRPASASHSAPQIDPAVLDLKSRSASPPTKTEPSRLPKFIPEQVVVTHRKGPEAPLFSPPATKLSSKQQPVVEQEATAEKSSDVTISIGHIEIRAAQALEQPRKPAFRPRVSLSEFLSQRNGERS